jgi:hypothetical protein
MSDKWTYSDTGSSPSARFEDKSGSGETTTLELTDLGGRPVFVLDVEDYQGSTRKFRCSDYSALLRDMDNHSIVDALLPKEIFDKMINAYKTKSSRVASNLKALASIQAKENPQQIMAKVLKQRFDARIVAETNLTKTQDMHDDSNVNPTGNPVPKPSPLVAPATNPVVSDSMFKSPDKDAEKPTPGATADDTTTTKTTTQTTKPAAPVAPAV